MSIKVTALVLALSFAAVGPAVDATEKLTMKTSPNVAYAPAHLTVRATVEADAANRALEIVIDSGDFYRSSLIELDGDNAPRTSILEFRGIPSGDYLVSAQLFGQGGEALALTRQQVNVIPSGIER
jgi:hypothetical protein